MELNSDFVYILLICWLQFVTQHHAVTLTVYCHIPFLIMFKDWSLTILEEPERGCQIFPLYKGKSISKLQMNIELKTNKSTDLENNFISQHDLPVH
jgi:hypothetical protein